MKLHNANRHDSVPQHHRSINGILKQVEGEFGREFTTMYEIAHKNNFVVDRGESTCRKGQW